VSSLGIVNVDAGLSVASGGLTVSSGGLTVGGSLRIVTGDVQVPAGAISISSTSGSPKIAADVLASHAAFAGNVISGRVGVGVTGTLLQLSEGSNPLFTVRAKGASDWLEIAFLVW
jgi:hypothetical protein